jgi:hypothetical protein
MHIIIKFVYTRKVVEFKVANESIVGIESC